MSKVFKKMIKPILFQGDLKKKNYFEGWYYKQVSENQKNVISFIPGISLFHGDYHSFIQYIFVSVDNNDKRTTKTGYVRFKLEDFKFHQNPFRISIGENTFSESKVFINIKDKDCDIKADINLGILTPLKKSIICPNIMGFFAYIPNMECYHGVISMNHEVSGKIKINNEEIDFNRGKGYIEKDWGTSFPKEYLWIQCNNFEDKGTSIFLSVADIPFGKKSFRGYIVNLLVHGKQYRFATYNNSKLEIEEINDKKIKISLENKDGFLKLEGRLTQPGGLLAPKKGEMNIPVKEELSGEVKLYFLRKRNKQKYEDVGMIAGIEVVGFNS